LKKSRFKKLWYYSLHNPILCYAIYFSSLLIFRFSFSALHNNTKSFMLPYKVHTFFDITNTRTYILMYLYLFPMLYASICHMAAICLVVILVFHICGELSILSYRIRNVEMYSKDTMVDRIRSFVQIHLKIVWWAYYSCISTCKMYNCLFLWLIYRQSVFILFFVFFSHMILSACYGDWRMAKSVDDTFNLILLDELFGNSIVLAISMYYVTMVCCLMFFIIMDLIWLNPRRCRRASEKAN